jgi:hypothetical protein
LAAPPRSTVYRGHDFFLTKIILKSIILAVLQRSP